MYAGMHRFFNFRICGGKLVLKLKRTRSISLSLNCQTVPDGVLQEVKQEESLKNKARRNVKKQKPFCSVVLDHFDHQYSEELGDLWPSARAVLLDHQSWQYGVMLNRFSTVTHKTQVLQALGFSSLPQQTHASALLCDGASAVSNSKLEERQDTLLSPPYVSKCPPEDFSLQPDTSSQDALSEFAFSLPHSSLKCYIHPHLLRFPSQAHRPDRLKHYYLLNAASVLPVLALQLRDGDKVLDLCSAPGGKAVAIMQSATPALLCCNELKPHRRNWLAQTLGSFLPRSLSSSVIVSGEDGRSFGNSKAGFYDKVLVDAPCSNDRSWLYSFTPQLGEERLEDRKQLPVLQAQLLRSALSAVRRGGVVVYSTCTLSSFENQAVVETVLNDFPEAELEDLWEEIAIPSSKYFAFSPHPAGGRTHSKPPPQPLNRNLGILVVPQPGRTWGPMFLSRIRRK